MLNIIDIFDRNIVDYHIGFHCEAKDATALLSKSLIKRELFAEGATRPVIRTDNGPQFVSYKFKECCEEFKLHHERIPVKTPNKMHMWNLSTEYLKMNVLKVMNFKAIRRHIKTVNDFINFYNNRRLHSSLRYMTPNEFLPPLFWRTAN